MRKLTIAALVLGGAILGSGAAYVYGIQHLAPGVNIQATEISAGSHSCAITPSGSLLCWGFDQFGRLGDGGQIESWENTRTDLVQVAGMESGVTAVSVSENSHTCAVQNGSAKCWGSNSHGQLGTGTRDDSSSPVPVIGLETNVVAVTAGGNHSCALTALGAVFCWGDSFGHEFPKSTGVILGSGEAARGSLTPVPVYGLSSNVVAIDAGQSHTCALTSEGVVGCWGDNASGQLGDGTTQGRNAPVRVATLSSPVASISASGHTTCAVTVEGAAYCWGNNNFGVLGDGSTIVRHTPTAVFGLQAGASAISVGGLHTCAIAGSGDLRCWGNNDNGQLGNGTRAGSFTPVPIRGSGVRAIASGLFHTCATFKRIYFVDGVRVEGDVVNCWGIDGDSIGSETGEDRLTPQDVKFRGR